MNKIFKSRIFSFILGAIIFGGIGVASAYTLLASDTGFTPRDTKWNVDNVQDAIDDLHTRASSKLVAIFNGSTGISSSTYKLPNIYIDNSYGYIDSNGYLVITKKGIYRVIGSVSHSPLNNAGTTWLNASLDDKSIHDSSEWEGFSASNNYFTYDILNTEIYANTNSVFKFSIGCDYNVSGIRAGEVVIIKK